MSKNRKKTNLIHKKGKEIFEISKDKNTGKFYIKGTNEEVQENKLSYKKSVSITPKYDFSKPFQAQFLGDEWADYPWGANDF